MVPPYFVWLNGGEFVLRMGMAWGQGHPIRMSLDRKWMRQQDMWGFVVCFWMFLMFFSKL